MFKRLRFKQTQSFKDRLNAVAEDMRRHAAKLAPGLKRDAFLRRARQADTASHLDDWANSSGLQAPK